MESYIQVMLKRNIGFYSVGFVILGEIIFRFFDISFNFVKKVTVLKYRIFRIKRVLSRTLILCTAVIFIFASGLFVFLRAQW